MVSTLDNRCPTPTGGSAVDGPRFDAIARSLAASGSRRRLIGGLIAGAVGAVGLRGADAAACRGAGSVCREHANCCSTLCGDKNATGRRVCVCPETQVACGGACGDPATAFQSDPANCGACGTRCPRTRCQVATCAQGSCGLAPDPAAVGLGCDDGDPCTTGDACTVQGACAGTPVDCSRLDGQCTRGVCNPQTGGCEAQNINEGQACDDGNPCTQTDTCQTGACTGGATVDCDDGNPCTEDFCDPTTGQCVHVEKNCDDNIDCTDDFCDTLTGQCVHTPIAGYCGGSEDPCLVPRCDPARATDSSGCVIEPTNCDDGNPCTDDFCDEIFGTCNHFPNNALCNDGLVCTTDTCIPHADGVTFECQHVFDMNNCGFNRASDCASFTCGVGNDCVLVYDDSKCTGGQPCQRGVCTSTGCSYENACQPTDCTPECENCTCAFVPGSATWGCLGTCGV
jgi:hypothetical protein